MDPLAPTASHVQSLIERISQKYGDVVYWVIEFDHVEVLILDTNDKLKWGSFRLWAYSRSGNKRIQPNDSHIEEAASTPFWSPMRVFIDHYRPPFVNRHVDAILDGLVYYRKTKAWAKQESAVGDSTCKNQSTHMWGYSLVANNTRDC